VSGLLFAASCVKIANLNTPDEAEATQTPISNIFCGPVPGQTHFDAIFRPDEPTAVTLPYLDVGASNTNPLSTSGGEGLALGLAAISYPSTGSCHVGIGLNFSKINDRGLTAFSQFPSSHNQRE
jgi:hypothetical protein